MTKVSYYKNTVHYIEIRFIRQNIVITNIYIYQPFEDGFDFSDGSVILKLLSLALLSFPEVLFADVCQASPARPPLSLPPTPPEGTCYIWFLK